MIITLANMLAAFGNSIFASSRASCVNFISHFQVVIALLEHKWVLFPVKLSLLRKGPLEVDLNLI